MSTTEQAPAHDPTARFTLNQFQSDDYQTPKPTDLKWYVCGACVAAIGQAPGVPSNGMVAFVCLDVEVRQIPEGWVCPSCITKIEAGRRAHAIVVSVPTWRSPKPPNPITPFPVGYDLTGLVDFEDIDTDITIVNHHGDVITLEGSAPLVNLRFKVYSLAENGFQVQAVYCNPWNIMATFNPDGDQVERFAAFESKDASDLTFRQPS